MMSGVAHKEEMGKHARKRNEGGGSGGVGRTSRESKGSGRGDSCARLRTIDRDPRKKTGAVGRRGALGHLDRPPAGKQGRKCTGLTRSGAARDNKPRLALQIGVPGPEKRDDGNFAGWEGRRGKAGQQSTELETKRLNVTGSKPGGARGRGAEVGSEIHWQLAKVWPSSTQQKGGVPAPGELAPGRNKRHVGVATPAG